jgi:hypothetical protein
LTVGEPAHFNQCLKSRATGVEPRRGVGDLTGRPTLGDNRAMEGRQLRTLLDLGSLVLLAMLVGSFIHVIRTALHAAH